MYRLDNIMMNPEKGVERSPSAWDGGKSDTNPEKGVESLRIAFCDSGGSDRIPKRELKVFLVTIIYTLKGAESRKGS